MKNFIIATISVGTCLVSCLIFIALIVLGTKTCPLCEQAKAKANEIISNEKPEHFEYHCSQCGTDIQIDFGKEM